MKNCRSLEQLHTFLRKSLKDLSLSYDFNKKEKIILNTIEQLQNYLDINDNIKSQICSK